MKSLVNKMLGSQPAKHEQVKAQLPDVRPVFESGKKGTKDENGNRETHQALALGSTRKITY